MKNATLFDWICRIALGIATLACVAAVAEGIFLAEPWVWIGAVVLVTLIFCNAIAWFGPESRIDPLACHRASRLHRKPTEAA